MISRPWEDWRSSLLALLIRNGLMALIIMLRLGHRLVAIDRSCMKATVRTNDGKGEDFWTSRAKSGKGYGTLSLTRYAILFYSVLFLSEIRYAVSVRMRQIGRFLTQVFFNTSQSKCIAFIWGQFWPVLEFRFRPAAQKRIMVFWDFFFLRHESYNESSCISYLIKFFFKVLLDPK